jgi:PTH1 family peptidyl-tRNA hydrolase
VQLLVGLGNPGREYARTRHNAGFMILDQLAAAERVSFRTEKKWDAEVAEIAGLKLCKPLRYMNLSGGPVRALCDFYKLTPEQVLVTYDDVALPLGKLRLRTHGSAGGHNGLQSVIDHLGSNAVPRLRIGIGAAAGATLVDHVLGRFSREEEGELASALQRAAEAIACVRERGYEVAMNQFN